MSVIPLNQTAVFTKFRNIEFMKMSKTTDNSTTKDPSLQESIVLQALKENGYTNQRMLSEETELSIGVVNQSLKALEEKGMIDENDALTKEAQKLFKGMRPKNAIILAAGFGMRMVPINLTTPKALLEVKGEPLIERIIDQLHEVGVTDITVVVGFMKESFEYLIDEKGVELEVNDQYAVRNNLYSLGLVMEKIGNTYIVPGDIWCAENPFSKDELYSWYMVSEELDDISDVRVNRKKQLVRVKEGELGNKMIGLSYITKDDAVCLTHSMKELIDSGRYDQSFWEEALYKGDRMTVKCRLVPRDEAVEITTYEQLRELDADSDHLKSDAITTIASVFGVKETDVTDIRVLKKGMTNRSFLFSVKGDRYIMRIPGEGTDKLINRVNEATVFKAISGLGLCDDPVYIDPKKGYKITKYLDNIRVCDPEDETDLKKCMKLLKKFHDMKLKVDHSFDIFRQIEFYESLWEGKPSIYRDYEKTKANVLSLKSYIDDSVKPEDRYLTHIDAVMDNFLFYEMPDGSEGLQLTDWEYAGMQDPHVDIAMFSIYAMYDKQEVDRLIDIYFEGKCPKETRAKIYCYVAACGLLWSNWCEFKRALGVEFGEYALRQYRFAKDYYKYAKELMQEL